MPFMQLTPKQPWLIITDLDGTLLDHDSYSFHAALPSLERLNRHQIPVIINSSKTEVEINTIRQQLNNHYPFIIENGSAIISPTTSIHTGHKKQVIGLPRQHILDKLHQLKQLFPTHFRCYSESSTEDIVEMTGLSLEQAALSAQREYTEPVQWIGDKQSKEAFMDAAAHLDIQCLQGGRFIHLMGNTDKGKAVGELIQKYGPTDNTSVKTIALGDSSNDIAMLQAADIAIVIRSPYAPPPEFEHPHKMISNYYGPEGWNECIEKLFLLTLTEFEEA